MMELEFPETLHSKIAATLNQQKKILRSAESNAQINPFYPASSAHFKGKGETRMEMLEKKKAKLDILVA